MATTTSEYSSLRADEVHRAPWYRRGRISDKVLKDVILRLYHALSGETDMVNGEIQKEGTNNDTD